MKAVLFYKFSGAQPVTLPKLALIQMFLRMLMKLAEFVLFQMGPGQ